MPDELRLSKSALDLWKTCPYAWYLGYVLRIKGAPTLQMIRGRAVHAGIEAHWKGEDHVERLQSEWDEGLASIPTYDAEEAAGVFLDALRLVATYVEKIAPGFQPTLVEEPFRIRVNGILVTGTIDAADGDVHDTKTTSTPSKVKPESHRVEMSIYRWGYQSLTGKLPGRTILDVVATNGRVKSVEVEPDDQGMGEVVHMVADSIRAGHFTPTGAYTGACHRCSFVAVCKNAVV